MSVRWAQDAGPTLDADVERMGVGGCRGVGGRWVVNASHQLCSNRTEGITRKKTTFKGKKIALVV